MSDKTEKYYHVYAKYSSPGQAASDSPTLCGIEVDRKIIGEPTRIKGTKKTIQCVHVWYTISPDYNLGIPYESQILCEKCKDHPDFGLLVLAQYNINDA